MTFSVRRATSGDSQKDMACASLGALIAMIVIALITWHYKRDFAREFGESLKLKRSAAASARTRWPGSRCKRDGR